MSLIQTSEFYGSDISWGSLADSLTAGFHIGGFRPPQLLQSCGIWVYTSLKMMGGKAFAFCRHMQELYGSILKDGDEPWMVVPHNKTADLYTYLRGFGFSFTVDCRGFCEDNVFCFNEGENLERLQAIVGQFPLN